MIGKKEMKTTTAQPAMKLALNTGAPAPDAAINARTANSKEANNTNPLASPIPNKHLAIIGIGITARAMVVKIAISVAYPKTPDTNKIVSQSIPRNRWPSIIKGRHAEKNNPARYKLLNNFP